MSTKAPRIPASTWDGYREEITALDTDPDGTLEKVMDTMKERHGFVPTKSQYLTKLKHWGLRKYANALYYTYADQKIKKRALEGKGTAFNIRGRNMSCKDMEREIGRNTTLSSRLQHTEDIPTPEGVQVFTPSYEEFSESITPGANIANIDNLSVSSLQKYFQALTVHMPPNNIFQSTIHNIRDLQTSQLDDLHNPQFGVKLLQMAIGDALKFEGLDMFIFIQDPDTGKQQRRYISSYFPPSDTENGAIWSPDGYMGLVIAAEAGNLEAVDMLLKAGSSVNEYMKDYFGTPLQAAIHTAQFKMAKFLIENGAEVNVPYADQNKHDWSITYKLTTKNWEKHNCVAKTPIQIACELDNIPMVELLLGHGALVDRSPLSHLKAEDMPETADLKSIYDDSICYSPNYQTIPYHTALQYSVQNRNMFLVRRLLSEGAHPDSRVPSNWGDTPLQTAARLNFPEIISVLIEKGADINAPPGRINGRTALQAAAESGNFEMVQLLLDMNADVNAPAGFKRGLTALQAAIKNDHSEVAALLLRSNADINAPPSEKEGLSTIGAAISGKNIFYLEFLLERVSGDTILGGMPTICAAAKFCWVDGARYLLKLGNNVNSYYVGFLPSSRHIWDAISALTWPIASQNLEMVKLLLDSGAEVNPRCPRTPSLSSSSSSSSDTLCFALEQRCHHEIIFLLFQKYAELGHLYLHKEAVALGVTYVYDKQGSTVILRLIQRIMSDLPEKLHSKYILYAWSQFSIHITQNGKDDIEEDHLKTIIDWLLEVGADVNIVEPFDNTTMLKMVVKSGKMKLIRYLLKIGAEIKVPGCHWMDSALFMAIKSGGYELALFLLERGTIRGASRALAVAARTGNIRIAAELLRRRAHVPAVTPLSYNTMAINNAALFGREDMLQLLLDHYGGLHDLWQVCQEAATHAEKFRHPEIAEWLRGYAVPMYKSDAQP
ncbi:uncharacterized protein BHQ10_003124 [Talaromyces amestolkiae]|uniref:Clr5 domain-containing protein n=1 Tax=Talaromyces amestolkiae TaxID=1196081 RepID=A0A364KU82_TALAM|nr:uncharacterized protein BHQ10_003124 [Talaromyces amestolkiae]RAO67112.1 hypothetical protein BHQ10_003124 [Talaromyces amestolkiae]